MLAKVAICQSIGKEFVTTDTQKIPKRNRRTQKLRKVAVWERVNSFAAG
jgi:hypothetical protein